MFGFGKTKIWRINVGADQIRKSGCNGADDFRDQKISSESFRLELESSTGNWLEKLQPRSGERFILTAIGEIGRNDSADAQHRAIAKGVLKGFKYVGTGHAQVEFKNLRLLQAAAHARAMPKPFAGNLHEVDEDDWKRL